MNAAIVVLAVLGVPMLIALSAMWRGYVLSVLWGWFFVPYLHAPPIMVPVAIGVSLIVGMLTNHRTGREVEKDGALVTAIGLAIFAPAIILLMGWIVTKFL